MAQTSNLCRLAPALRPTGLLGKPQAAGYLEEHTAVFGPWLMCSARG